MRSFNPLSVSCPENSAMACADFGRRMYPTPTRIQGTHPPPVKWSRVCRRRFSLSSPQVCEKVSDSLNGDAAPNRALRTPPFDPRSDVRSPRGELRQDRRGTTRSAKTTSQSRPDSHEEMPYGLLRRFPELTPVLILDTRVDPAPVSTERRLLFVTSHLGTP